MHPSTFSLLICSSKTNPEQITHNWCHIYQRRWLRMNHCSIPWSRACNQYLNGLKKRCIFNFIYNIWSLSKQLRECLPEEYENLSSISADILPGNSNSKVYPFTALVLNTNVSTNGHRDQGDFRVCMVIPIGDFEGGELVLVEPGFVFDLQQGDVIVFPSGEITHLNLHYKGTRASLVLHTDREFRSWATDRNGWESNATMLV